MTAYMTRLFRRKLPPEIAIFSTRRPLSTNAASSSKLRSKYNFISPPSLHPQPPDTSTNCEPEPESKTRKRSKSPYRPPSSLERPDPPVVSNLPFDFRFSYTESNAKVRPIGLREPKYSPFGPGRLDREWTGVCAPAVDPKVGSAKIDGELEKKRREMRDRTQGEPLTNAERKAIVERFQRPKTKMQINLGRDGLTHNMLDVIHNHWKNAEAVRIKCMGVPTVDMKNICTHLEDKTFGKIIHRHGGLLILYRGRHYKSSKRPVVPLMLWKPQEPVYPRLIKTTIEGLSIEETKEMRKRGLSVPALTRLAKNGYYGSLVPMVRDAFLSDELVRIDCKGLPRSDYKRIGCKLRDLVPCILVTFDKEQIVMWRGEHYKPAEGGYFLMERESFENPNDDASDEAHENGIPDYEQGSTGFDSGDSDNE
ncbi:RNA-binding CRS1 / YhbY domain-containing protein [Perilla frutescens var. hirtella]|uniref:RNA-binding CRS1 / YhbY domain-containing protein n=1 Tax=Perilla frutescens var. hirtella TaxID=608512 RepID=A0AAD4JBJ7_PERFH|nr:RNA-binding CRS1 / YhbY domain-containing protein [Perilla frutescens var. hirtella]